MTGGQQRRFYRLAVDTVEDLNPDDALGRAVQGLGEALAGSGGPVTISAVSQGATIFTYHYTPEENE